MKLSEAAAIIESAVFDEDNPYTLMDIRLSQHGLIAHIGMPLRDETAECTITVSALDLEQARYPAALIRVLTKDATEKLRRFLSGEVADAAIARKGYVISPRDVESVTACAR